MNRFPKTDPYGVLGLQRGCTAAEIKAAYKKLALKNHPDRAPPAEKEAATARFKVVGEAYEFLSDDRKRREYDNFGPGRTSGNYAPGPEYEDDLTRKHFGTSPNGVPFTFVWESSADSARRAQAGRRTGRPFGADGFDPFELFNMMFSNEFGSMNGGGGGGASRAQDPFARMNSGQPMGGSVFGNSDPFSQNHRMMADSMGFGFGAPPAPSRAPPGPSMGMHSAGPFSSNFASTAGNYNHHSTSTSTSTSTTYGGFGGTSQSTTTRTVNGRTETITRNVDASGNVTVHTSTPEGNTVHVNGVQQAHHPLLGNGTVDDPIVIDS